MATSSTQVHITAPVRTQCHPKPQLPLPVFLNIECDKLASTTSKIALGEHRTDLVAHAPPFSGSKAMLRIGSTWITSKLQDHVLRARWTADILHYCANKYGWDSATSEDIAWKVIGAARRKCTPTQKMQTSKIMHDWLPVKHMQAHIGGTADCPLCSHPDKTLDHLFHCPHPVEILLEELRKKGLKLGIPRLIIGALTSILVSYITGEEPQPHSSPLLSTAIRAQACIGNRLIPRGFLSYQWLEAMESLGCSNSHRKLAALIYHLWNSFTDGIWRERNQLTHKSRNFNNIEEEQALDERLQWYAENYRTTLSRHHHRLIHQVDLTTLDTIPFRTKRQMLYHLDTARDTFAWTGLTGQTLLTQYFLPQPDATQ
jgi:hypothetical protein